MPTWYRARKANFIRNVSILKKVKFSKNVNNINVSFVAKLNNLSQDYLDMTFKQLENIPPVQE